MAVANTYTMQAADVGLYAKTLTGGSEDQVTVNRSRTGDAITLTLIADGTAAVYFTVDGSAPSVAGVNGYELPSGVVSRRTFVLPSGQNTVRILSAGAAKYSVAREY